MAGSSENTRPARERLPRAERREAILNAATSAFAAAGYAGTSMADIANASGVTLMIIYRHFQSKEDLYRALLQRVSDRLAREFSRCEEPEAFGVGAHTALTVAREDPEGFVLLWRHAAREPQFASYASDLKEETARNAAAAIALSERMPPEAHQWAGHAVTSYLIEAVVNWIEYGDPRRDKDFVRATNAAMRAGTRAWLETSTH